MNQSSFFKLNLKDTVKGFLVTVLTVVIAGLITVLDSGKLPDLQQLKALGITGVTAGLAYLCKNVLTNSKDQFAKPEPKQNDVAPK